MIWQESRQWQNQVLNTSVILLKFLLLLVSPLSPLRPHSHQHTSVGAVSPPWTCLHFPEFGINGAYSVWTLLWMACCTMISLRLTHLVPRVLSSLFLLLSNNISLYGLATVYLVRRLLKTQELFPFLAMTKNTAMNIPMRNVSTRSYFPLAQVDKGLGLERWSLVLDICLTFLKTMNCFSKWLYRLSIPINSTWKSQSFLTLFNLEYTGNCVVFSESLELHLHSI